MSEKIRPVVFVGSSKEGLSVAKAIQQNLDHDAEVILWSQGFFGLEKGTTLETLVDSAHVYDFAVLVLTPDDLLLSRGEEKDAPRDNVIFELGLFMGALGRKRTYIVSERNAEMKFPSDLGGVSKVDYAPPTVGTLQSAVGACSTAILEAVKSLGKRRARDPGNQIDAFIDFVVLAGLLEVSIHQFLILMNQNGKTLERESHFQPGLPFEYAIESPRRRESGHGVFSVDTMCKKLADADLLTIDLHLRVGLTIRGATFAKWLADSDRKAMYFWCALGTWGTRPESLPYESPSESPESFLELAGLSKQEPPRKTKKSQNKAG